MKVLTFDIEIKNCVPEKDAPNDPAYTYCGGWDDKENMGISIIATHKSWTGEVEMFDEHTLLDFIGLIQKADLVTGFNIFGFDTPLLKATLARLGLPEKTGMGGKCYDILADIKKSLGAYPKGWTMDAVASATVGSHKLAEGAMAPKLWQDGRFAELYNYAANDVLMEANLFQFALEYGYVRNHDVDPGRLDLDGIKKWQEIAKKEEEVD